MRRFFFKKKKQKKHTTQSSAQANTPPDTNYRLPTNTRTHKRNNYKIQLNYFGAYVQVVDGDVDVVEQLSVVLDAVTRGEENDDFFAQVLLQEGEEQEKTSALRAHNITLS